MMRSVFKTTYDQDLRWWKHGGDAFWNSMLLALMLLMPLALDEFYLGELSHILIFAVTGLGLMVLVGFTGLVSLGHAAFMAIGAYAHAWMLTQGVPFLLSFPLSGVVAATAGILLAIPALRMTGLYLAIATLAFAIIIEELFSHWDSVTGGYRGMAVPLPELLGIQLWQTVPFYYLSLLVLVAVIAVVLNLLRSPIGRALIAIRDSEISAQSLGIPLARTKVIAFGMSACITGLGGALFAHKAGYLAPEGFNILTSIQLLMMVVVGGLGTVHGAVYGAIFVGFLPQALALLRDFLPPAIADTPGMEPGIFGLILALFIVFEPQGIYGRWRKIRLYFEIFPLYRRSTFKRQKAFLRTDRMQ